MGFKGLLFLASWAYAESGSLRGSADTEPTVDGNFTDLEAEDIFMPLRPMRAIAYGALPCAMPIAQSWAPEMKSCNLVGLPSEDMMQEGYAKQWNVTGRDDLGRMKALGGNAVRLYHSLGLEGSGSHQGFLDRALHLELNVMPGYHSTEPKLCDNFDCFKQWKEATLQGFEQGFEVKGAWHPAVSALIIMNEPDFYENDMLCKNEGAWCRARAVLSALDGVLAAEEEAEVLPGRTKLTVTWSFAMRTSIDGKVQGPGTFGFQDMVAVVGDPSLVDYEPRTSLDKIQEAFRTRRWGRRGFHWRIGGFRRIRGREHSLSGHSARRSVEVELRDFAIYWRLP